MQNYVFMALLVGVRLASRITKNAVVRVSALGSMTVRVGFMAVNCSMIHTMDICQRHQRETIDNAM